MICLFPNTTHILQPLDVSVFAPLKAKWKSTVHQWRVDNDGKEICKQDVPTVFQTILNNSNFTNSIKSGFRVCGFFPWKADKVDYSKCTLKECPTITSTQQSESTNRSPHLNNLEKYIKPSLLREFYLTKDRHTDWEGSITASDLYDVWDKMLYEYQNQNTLKPSINCEANKLQTNNTTTDSTSQLQTIVLNNISPKF